MSTLTVPIHLYTSLKITALYSSVVALFRCNIELSRSNQNTFSFLSRICRELSGRIMVQELAASVMVMSTGSKWLEAGGSHQSPEISLNNSFRNAVTWDLLLPGAVSKFQMRLLKVLFSIKSFFRQRSIVSDSISEWNHTELILPFQFNCPWSVVAVVPLWL